MPKAPEQFMTLDCLRGIAALGVMVFHDRILGASAMPSGYLAVDLFFLLSGFVIAHAYRRKMAESLGPRAFLYRRAIRLWPMLALGALLGIVLHNGHVGSLFLLPNPKSPLNLYPANPPLWSLLFEGLAYLAFAFGLRRAGPRLLAAISIVCACALAGLALSDGPLVDFGAHWHSLGAGLARLGFGFSGGMLMWHVWQAKAPMRRTTMLAWLMPIALIAIMAAVPMDSQVMALLAIVVGFPTILWLALRWEIPQMRIARALGDLSYPLYCIHVPLIVWLSHGAAASLALFVALPCVALLIDRRIDRPVRANLSRMLARDVQPEGYTRIGIKT